LLGIYAGGIFLAGLTRSQGAYSLVLLAAIAFTLLSFVPLLAVTVRRLHDSDKSGWWLLLVFIPFGTLILFIFTLLDSSVGFNRYGPPHGEMPGDKRVQYWGTTREEAWAKFVGDASDAAANGYQPVSQKWIPYVGGQALEVLYRGRPLDPWGGGQIPESGPPRW
jgi:hypothetical protein